MNKGVLFFAFLLSIGACFFFAATSTAEEKTPPESQKTALRDGDYTAENPMLGVSVTIRGGKIYAIEILEHKGGGQKYEEMVKTLIPEIIEKQSTRVDAVTGATVSSDALREAVESALKKARQ